MLYQKVIKLSLKRSFYEAGLRVMSTKPSVYLTRGNIPDEALRILREKCDVEIWKDDNAVVPRDELIKQIAGKNAIYCLLTEKIDKELLDAAGPSLKVIGTMSVGHDHIDLDECKKRNIQVGYTPDVLTDDTANLAVALLLATSRRLIEASSEVYNGNWSKKPWNPTYMCGKTLTNSVIGIVGLGNIGYAIAERVNSFKIKELLYTGNNEKPYAKNIGAKYCSFEELLQNSDFVIASCALNEKTKELFNDYAFNQMKSSAIFINIGRGGLVDQNALCRALSNNKIYAAGLDVMTPEPLPLDSPLLKLKNCVLLPHIGSATIETRTKMAVLTSENIVAALEGKPMPSPLLK